MSVQAAPIIVQLVAVEVGATPSIDLSAKTAAGGWRRSRDRTVTPPFRPCGNYGAYRRPTTSLNHHLNPLGDTKV